MANLERIRAVVERIEGWEKFPGPIKFNMGEWYQEEKSGDFCETSVCFAGAAVVVEGVTIKKEDEDYADYCAVIDEDGYTVAIERWAADYFGLSWDEADEIFFCDAKNAQELKAEINGVLGEEVFTELSSV